MAERNMREFVAIVAALLPFLAMAAIGYFGDSGLLLANGLFLPALAALIYLHAGFLVLRFSHVDPTAVPARDQIPKKVLVGRAALYLVAIGLLLCWAKLKGSGSTRTTLTQFAASGVLGLAIGNIIWRRWTRSIGLDPDAILVAVSKR